jgi:transcriptional repressor NrdR
LLCPVCRSGSIKVLDSRESRDGGAIRRRRACLDCNHRFTTYERIETTPPIVLKRGGGKQAFDRNKIRASLQQVCHKRPVDDEQIEALLGAVELWAATRGEKEIRAEEIADRVTRMLWPLDPVAYVRFVSIHAEYQTVEDFVRLLSEMEKAAHTSPEGQRTLFEIDARGQIFVSAPSRLAAFPEGEDEADPGDRSPTPPESEGA